MFCQAQQKGMVSQKNLVDILVIKAQPRQSDIKS